MEMTVLVDQCFLAVSSAYLKYNFRNNFPLWHLVLELKSLNLRFKRLRRGRRTGPCDSTSRIPQNQT